jgi:hypothetical protein
LENLDTEVEINSIWETVRENINISAKESLGIYEVRKHEHGSMKDAQNYLIKGKKLNYGGYSIHVK